MFDLSLKDQDEADDDLIMQAQSAAVQAMSPHRPQIELLMFALPHHQERLRPTDFSSNEVKEYGCHANLHGTACPVRYIHLFIFGIRFISILSYLYIYIHIFMLEIYSYDCFYCYNYYNY